MSWVNALQRIAEIRSLGAPAAAQRTSSSQQAAQAQQPIPAQSAAGFAQQLEAATSTSSPLNLSPSMSTKAVTSPNSVSSVSGDTPFAELIDKHAKKNGVPPALVKAVIRQESNFDSDAGSPAGAQGLMQLMPATARSLGVRNIRDPEENIAGGTRYLKEQLDRFGSIELALAAYNAGPGAVSRYDGIPPYAETRNYVRSVMQYYKQYS